MGMEILLAKIHAILPSSVYTIGENASAVNFAPVADADDQYAHLLILDAGDHSIIADAVFPQMAKLTPFERFANAPRILKTGHTLVKKAEDPTSYC
jgi:hypothetical protein